ELLSQAWSAGNGIFRTPPWMKIMIRDSHDPFAVLKTGNSGLINIVDLANYHSCSFIATSDLGRTNEDGSFEVLGRMDNTDIRGCNLLIA
ncbi:MAG TPA: acyltransferase, partial [Bacteroidales bacterium]|nr:acyltransferase [Bacteroidales bacterium]